MNWLTNWLRRRPREASRPALAPGKRFRPRLEHLEAREVPALVINPTFGPTILADPQAAKIMASINAAIQKLESYIYDNITVSITFNEMAGGLGQSLSFYKTVSYSAYRAALVSHQWSSV